MAPRRSFAALSWDKEIIPRIRPIENDCLFSFDFRRLLSVRGSVQAIATRVSLLKCWLIFSCFTLLLDAMRSHFAMVGFFPNPHELIPTPSFERTFEGVRRGGPLQIGCYKQSCETADIS